MTAHGPHIAHLEKERAQIRRAGAATATGARSGGRIYERTHDGCEIDWGEITGWEPPHLLAYRWHLRRDRADATDVEIRFVAVVAGDGDGESTRVEITHTGLGAPRRRGRQLARGEPRRVEWTTAPLGDCLHRLHPSTEHRRGALT